MLCNNTTASVVIGVIGVTSISNISSYRQDPMITSLRTLTTIGGFSISLSTLSRLNGNNLVTAYVDLMFLLVKALTLTGLYREVKCSLLIVSIPP